MQEPMTTAPAMELPPQAIDQLVEALRAYHASYRPLLQRREQRAGAAPSLHGLWLDIPRKSIEPMVLALAGPKATAVRTRPLLISAGAWDDEGRRHRPWQEGDTSLGEDDGGRTVAGSAFLQPGQASVGVKRPDGGAVGTRAHGQAGVSVGDARRQGAPVLERRRSLPPAWVEDEAYAERRRRCGVPPTVTLKTKPMLGWEMIQAGCRAGTLRARWVAWDEAFGRDPTLLDHIACLGLWSFAEVPHDTQGWRQRPATAGPAWGGRGRQPTRARVVAGAPTPQTGGMVAESWPAEDWARHRIQEGSQGPIGADGAARRVIALREGWPGPEGWLVRRRPLVTGALQTSRWNAPADTPVATLGRLSGRRWPIETCGADGKPSLGMGDEAGRGWRGWPHPLPLWMLAHFLLVRGGLR